MKKLVLIFALSVLAFYRSGTAQTPRAVVERYLYLETHGALLDSSDPNMKLIDRLLINEDESGYDTATIVRSYRITKVSVAGHKATVIVHYENLGTLASDGFERKAFTEHVPFPLTLTTHGWKIDGLLQVPHVLAVVMAAHLQKLLSPPGEAKDDAALKSEIAQLKSNNAVIAANGMKR